jgi:single-stranded-DNA-specific exonuclease
MNRPRPKWILPQPDDSQLEQIFPRFTRAERHVLFSLGFTSQDEAIEFLNGNKQYDLDPFLLLNMNAAADRIHQAIDRNESITIYADYDADGVTSAALLYEVLKSVGGTAQVYFPDRFTQGYGLNSAALEQLAAEGTDLVITVDCGIRAGPEADIARQLGLDLIITDHHHPPDQLPDASVILNPNQDGDTYPNKGLAGVGVAYKLARALLAGIPPKTSPPAMIDLVAIGTVADMSPLTGENRQLVRAGLECINSDPALGLKALMAAAGYQPGRVDSRSIGFVLGPRINAAGRLERAQSAFDLLISTDATRAMELADHLDRINRRRQDLTYEVVQAAAEQLSDESRTVLSAFNENFHEGVVGLAASRLTEEYFRPSMVGKIGPKTTRASARSVPGFHLAQALDACSEYLIRYGGHEKAAGFTVANERREEFLAQFERVATQQLNEDLLTPRLEIHAQIDLEDIDSRLMTFHDRMEPTGQDNPRPLLASRGLRITYRRRVGEDGKHLKLRLAGDAAAIDAIAFRQGDLCDELPELVDVAFRLERNEYRGTIAPQLVIEDIRAASP